MSSHAQWARIIEAVGHPASMPSPAQRAEMLQTALSLGTTVVPDLVGCSVTQAVDGGYQTPAASNGLARSLDDAQYELGDGPCVAACRDGRMHGVAVMDDERAFGGFTDAAVRKGVHSSLSLPLARPQPSALNLYAGDQRAFDDNRPRAAAAFLARCVAGLLPEGDLPRPRVEADSAMAQRSALISRAQAIVADREGCEPHEAFRRLTVLSRERQLGLFDVARAVVGSGGVEAGVRS